MFKNEVGKEESEAEGEVGKGGSEVEGRRLRLRLGKEV